VAGDTSLHWKFSGWGVETTLETKRLGSGDNTGDLLLGEWRRHWRLSVRGLETTVEQLGSGDDSGHLVGGN